MSKARDLANAGTALTTVSATELGYLDGVTSAVQTQINAKQAVVSGVDSTEIGYLDGVTSAIQTQINAQIPKSTVTTKGDILVATGSGTVVRQGVGTDGQVLVADSAQADGVNWATPSAGGMTLLATTTLSGTSTVVSSISQAYKSLLVVGYGVTWSAGNTVFEARANSTGSAAPASGVQSGAATNRSVIYPFAGGNEPSNSNNAFSFTINNYTSSTHRKPFILYGGFIENNASSVFGGTINITSAITSLQYTTAAGTATLGGTVLLYGVN